jgi:hypothetical protein
VSRVGHKKIFEVCAIFVVAASVFAPLTNVHAGANPPKSLCAATEFVYFSCQTARKKLISVCGSKPDELTDAAGTLQYRFGASLKHIELSFPADAKLGREEIKHAHYARADVDLQELSFTRGDTEYTVFDRSEGRARTSGVEVTHSNGKSTRIRCAKPLHSEMESLQRILKCDPNNALSGGNCVPR